jgi:hypothetical protein
MSRRIYIAIIMIALLLIAIGGWTVDVARWLRGSRPVRARLAPAA